MWCFTDHYTISPANQVPWCQVVNKKRELFPGLLPTYPSSVALLQIWTKSPEYPRSCSGILTQFPFNKWPMIGHFEKEFAYLLGSTNPCPTAVHIDPFSTSVFKVLIWIFATTTKICTRSHFTQAHARDFTTTPTPPYSSELRYLLWRLSIDTTLESHLFSELADSAGVLLHTL